MAKERYFLTELKTLLSYISKFTIILFGRFWRTWRYFLGWQLYWSSKLSLFLFIFDITFNIGHFHFCIFNFEFGYSLSSTRSSNGIGHFTMLAVDNRSSNNIFLNVVGFCYMNDFEEFYTKIIRPGRWWVYGVFIHIWRAQTQRQMKIWKGHGRKRNG